MGQAQTVRTVQSMTAALKTAGERKAVRVRSPQWDGHRDLALNGEAVPSEFPLRRGF